MAPRDPLKCTTGTTTAGCRARKFAPGGRRAAGVGAADHAPDRDERNVDLDARRLHRARSQSRQPLTSNEWHFDVETFRRVDAIATTRCNLTEFLGEGVDDDRDDSFDDLDYNNNGRVERTEWYGGLAEFRGLDATTTAS